MNALDLAASKIYFSANNMAANPSFLSEGYYVNITEQFKGMCFNLNSIAVPELSSLFPSFTESSQYSQFKNGRMSCRKHNCSARSFSAVYVNLRHNRLCLPEYLPKRVFEQLFCMYPSVETVSEARLSLSLSLHARAKCVRQWLRASPETRANDTLHSMVVKCIS